MYDTQSLALLMAESMPTIVASSIIAWLIAIIPYWWIFKKAGEKSWKAVIPVYSMYIQYKFSWKF